MYRTADFFAGVGGIRLGFEQAGFMTAFANDCDQWCKLTYDMNFDTVPLTVGRIEHLDSSLLPSFDVLLAGFPCQAFSIAGYRHGFYDAGRGDLFFELARVLEEKHPIAFFLENVKNLRTHDSGRTFETISAILTSLGYHTKSKVLNSMEYGNVPQNRERIYIVGFSTRDAYDAFDFPNPIHLTKGVQDVLEESVDSRYYYDCDCTLYDRLANEVQSSDTVYQWRRAYVRENKCGVCPTLTANMGMGGHNVPIIRDDVGIRKLTPRECARLQGFPDDYLLPRVLPDSKLYKQLGNSVTVTVVGRVAKQMLLALQCESYVPRESRGEEAGLLQSVA